MSGRQRVENYRLRVFQFRNGKAHTTAVEPLCLFLEWHRKRLLPPPPNAAVKRIPLQIEAFQSQFAGQVEPIKEIITGNRIGNRERFSVSVSEKQLYRDLTQI
jgi:hypothetical protein